MLAAVEIDLLRTEAVNDRFRTVSSPLRELESMSGFIIELIRQGNWLITKDRAPRTL